MDESEDAAGSRQNWSWSVGARRPRGLPLSGRGVRRYLHRRHRRNHPRNHPVPTEPRSGPAVRPAEAVGDRDFRLVHSTACAARACTARAHTNITCAMKEFKIADAPDPTGVRVERERVKVTD